MKPSYLWLTLVAPAWAMFATGANYWRLSSMEGVEPNLGWIDLRFLLGFALVGALSGGGLIFMLRRSTGVLGPICLVCGYVLAIPVGFIFGIFGPFSIPETIWAYFEGFVHNAILIGVIGIWGSFPLAAGTGLGYAIGRLIRRVSVPNSGHQ